MRRILNSVTEKESTAFKGFGSQLLQPKVDQKKRAPKKLYITLLQVWRCSNCMQIELASALTRNYVLIKRNRDSTTQDIHLTVDLVLASLKSCTRVLLHQKAMIFTHKSSNMVRYLQEHSCSLVSVIHSRERQMLWSLSVNSGCRSPRKISNGPRGDAVWLRKTNANWGIGFCVDKNSVSYQCKLRFDNTVYISNSRVGTCFFEVIYPSFVTSESHHFHS